MGILFWDQETMMSGGATPGAEVVAELSLMVHELERDERLPHLLAVAEEQREELNGE